MSAQLKESEHAPEILDEAMRLAAEGFHVFPLIPEGTELKGGKIATGKEPALAFTTKATDDPETLREWFGPGGRYVGYGLALRTGTTRKNPETGAREWLVVVDVDMSGHGKDGLSALKAACSGAGISLDDCRTRVQETPGSGWHALYWSPVQLRAGVDVLGPQSGVDIKAGTGAYIAVAPTAIDGKRYRWEDPAAPIASMGNLADLFPQGNPEPKAADRAPLPGIDPERARARAIEYLTHQAPEAVEGAGGDNTTFKVAAKLKDLGVDEAVAVELMLEHWHDGCGWSPDELAVKVANAFRYGANPPGADAPECQFQPVEVELRKARYRFASVSDLLSRPRPTWLVRGLLPARGLGVVYGAPGSGKSFLMLDLAAAIARGESWAGQRVRSGRVAYISLEGAMRDRIEAYLQHHGIDLSDMAGLQVLERQSVNLLTDDERDAKDLISDIQAGGPVSLVVVDTLNRAMPGGNENASEDMGRVIRCAGLIASMLECLCVFVHHSGKDSSAGARGHSSLLGAADAELEVSRQGTDSATRFVRATKVKDGEDGARFSFSLETIDLGPTQAHDPDAGPEERDTSCVVADLGKSEVPLGKTARKWTPLRQNVLAALRNLLSDRFAATGTVATCSVTEWQQAYFDATPLPDQEDPKAARKDKNARQKNFGLARDWLTAEKLVETVKKKGAIAYRLAGDF